MFERFYPHKLAGNVFELGVDFYISQNIRGVIFDIDNTLVTHDTARPPKEIADYFRSLREAGIRCGVVSNNYADRVEPFCKDLGVPFISRAWKPFKKNLRAMQKTLSLDSKNICLVGDQIFTDIYGGRRMGFYTVLVTAVGENETGFVAFKRIFEKAVLDEFKRKNLNNR